MAGHYIYFFVIHLIRQMSILMLVFIGKRRKNQYGSPAERSIAITSSSSKLLVKFLVKHLKSLYHCYITDHTAAVTRCCNAFFSVFLHTVVQLGVGSLIWVCGASYSETFQRGGI